MEEHNKTKNIVSNKKFSLQITEDNWFECIVGFPENEWNFTLDNISKKIAKDMGDFEQHRLDDLEKEFSDQNKEILDENKKLKVRIRTSYVREDLFDTSSLQINGKEKALYQVASNFNCMEIPNKHSNVFSGKYLTNLMSDSTQGPSASGGAGYGAILRVVSHHENPINLLSDTDLKPENGKLLCVKSKNDFKYSDIKIGLHSNVRATFNRSDKFEYKPDGPIIDQVYTSTCICSNTQPNKMSEILLKASYDGTYLCAIKNQNSQLILTAIGGGVFRNSLDQIGEAISNAHKKYAKYLPKDCEVILPIYQQDPKALCDAIKKYMKIDLDEIKG